MKITVSLDRIGHRRKHFLDEVGEITRRLLHLADQLEIDIRNRQTVQIGIQQHVQLQKRLIVERFFHLDDAVADKIAVHHDNRQNLMFIHRGKLHETHAVQTNRRSGNHRSVLRVVREDLDDLLQDFFHLVRPLNHQILDIGNLLILGRDQTVDVKTVALVRRNPSGRSVRLNDIAEFLKIAHLIPDGC